MIDTRHQLGTSILHRAPVRWKFVGLSLIGALVLAVPSPALLLGLCIGLVAAGTLAGISFEAARRPLAMVAVTAAAILAFHAASGTFRLGVTTVLALSVTVLAATLVTATTRISEMIGAFEAMFAPLRRLGVDPARPALMFALAIRFIPLLAGEFDAMRQARLARGGRPLSLTLVTPLIVTALRSGDELAQALVARGFEAHPDND